MKLKSVSGFVCYVKDLEKTAKFYKDLGFLQSARDENHVSFRLNWFSIDFVDQDKEAKEEFKKEANAQNKGAGMFINISVESVDDFYKGVINKGLKPSSEPRDWPWGNREFVLRDPDGYKLVFFQKI
ncbi:MAG: VOC family protein [Patescibacteria group bacterium]|nr:VOC family protein [Patescibacteria group bacterium]